MAIKQSKEILLIKLIDSCNAQAVIYYIGITKLRINKQ